jgi:hypothetical protein
VFKARMRLAALKDVNTMATQLRIYLNEPFNKIHTAKERMFGDRTRT